MNNINVAEKSNKTPEMDGEYVKKEAESCVIEYELETDVHKNARILMSKKQLKKNIKGL